MPSRVDKTGGEVDWPAQFERTQRSGRERTSKFSLTFHQAISRIETELMDRVGADDWRLSTAAPHRKDDGMPYANANPDDPAVVIRWTKDGEQFAVACDHYTSWRDNARAIGLYIREKRKMSNRPVTTGQDEFATARLPSGEEDDNVIVAGSNGAGIDDPHEVLGVSPDASEAVIEAAARQRLKETHPDQDGDSEEYIRVQQAREELLGDA